MRLSVLQPELAKALNLASRFISTRAQLPILTNVLLSAEKTKLTFRATNLETSVSIAVGAKTTKIGEVAIPARLATDLVSNLPNSKISLDSQKEQLKISSESFSGVVVGMNTSDFPEIPRQVSKKGAIRLPRKEFVKALNQVLFAVSPDDTRPTLAGVLMIFKGATLTLVASDGFRLSSKTIDLGKSMNEEKIILPRSVLSELARIVGDDTNEILFNHNKKDNQVIFGFSNIVLASRVIEGEYPDFERIIPKSNKITASVGKEDLLSAIKLASVFARDAANVIRFAAEKSGIKIYAESAKVGSQEAQVEAKIDGGVVEISYNWRFIEEFLSAIDGDNVVIELNDSASPGVFKDPKDPKFLHLIMPVRV